MLQEGELSPVGPASPALGPGQGLKASARCGWQGERPHVKAGPGTGETRATAQCPWATQLCGQPPRGVVEMMKRDEVMVSNALGKRREAGTALSSARLAFREDPAGLPGVGTVGNLPDPP